MGGGVQKAFVSLLHFYFQHSRNCDDHASGRVRHLQEQPPSTVTPLAGGTPQARFKRAPPGPGSVLRLGPLMLQLRLDREGLEEVMENVTYVGKCGAERRAREHRGQRERGRGAEGFILSSAASTRASLKLHVSLALNTITYIFTIPFFPLPPPPPTPPPFLLLWRTNGEKSIQYTGY